YCRVSLPHSSLALFFLMIPRPPIFPLFPYTTLFRSFAASLAIFSLPNGRHKGAASLAVVGQIAALVMSFFAFLPTLRAQRTTLRSEEHTSELQSLTNLVCRLLLEKKKIIDTQNLVKY